MKLISILLVTVFCAACASLPLNPDDAKKVAITAACTTLELGRCFDEPALQGMFKGIDASNCVSRIESAGFLFSPADLRKIKKPDCYKVLEGLRVK